MELFDPDSLLEEGAVVALPSGRLFIGWGKRTWLHSSEGNNLFFFPDFFLKNKQLFFTHEKSAVMTIEELEAYLKSKFTSFAFEHFTIEGKELFEKKFLELKQIFANGGLEKAVPYVFAKGEMDLSQKHLAHILLQLIAFSRSHGTFLYGFWNGQEGMVGSTPEHLFSLDGRELSTVACAGTLPAELAASALKDEKLCNEHQLVVQGIRLSLAPFGRLEIGEMKAKSFGRLAHLMTQMHLNLCRDVPFEHLVLALHPTPALGAYPKERGKLWLLEYEKELPRGRFGAPAGVVLEGQAHVYVAIRNLQWSGKTLLMGAGCGVVKKSVLQNEWEEIKLKLQAIKEAVIGNNA